MNVTAIWAAVAAGIPGLIAAVIGIANRGKLTEIHVLVNSKMQTALETIAGLRNDAAAAALGDAARAQTDREQSATQVRQDATEVSQHSRELK